MRGHTLPLAFSQGLQHKERCDSHDCEQPDAKLLDGKKSLCHLSFICSAVLHWLGRTLFLSSQNITASVIHILDAITLMQRAQRHPSPPGNVFPTFTKTAEVQDMSHGTFPWILTWQSSCTALWALSVAKTKSYCYYSKSKLHSNIKPTDTNFWVYI